MRVCFIALLPFGGSVPIPVATSTATVAPAPAAAFAMFTRRTRLLLHDRRSIGIHRPGFLRLARLARWPLLLTLAVTLRGTLLVAVVAAALRRSVAPLIALPVALVIAIAARLLLLTLRRPLPRLLARLVAFAVPPLAAAVLSPVVPSVSIAPSAAAFLALRGLPL
jgi:hypothetical protein